MLGDATRHVHKITSSRISKVKYVLGCSTAGKVKKSVTLNQSTDYLENGTVNMALRGGLIST
jgi:hypothetical protein